MCRRKSALQILLSSKSFAPGRGGKGPNDGACRQYVDFQKYAGSTLRDVALRPWSTRGKCHLLGYQSERQRESWTSQSEIKS